MSTQRRTRPRVADCAKKPFPLPVYAIIETFFDVSKCKQARSTRVLSPKLEFLLSHCVSSSTLYDTNLFETLTKRNFIRTSEGGWIRFMLTTTSDIDETRH